MSGTYYVLVKLRPGVGLVRLSRRHVLMEHGRFGPCHMLPAEKALELVDAGVAKLRPGMSVRRLRAEVAAMTA